MNETRPTIAVRLLTWHQIENDHVQLEVWAEAREQVKFPGWTFREEDFKRFVADLLLTVDGQREPIEMHEAVCLECDYEASGILRIDKGTIAMSFRIDREVWPSTLQQNPHLGAFQDDRS